MIQVLPFTFYRSSQEGVFFVLTSPSRTYQGLLQKLSREVANFGHSSTLRTNHLAPAPPPPPPGQNLSEIPPTHRTDLELVSWGLPALPPPHDRFLLYTHHSEDKHSPSQRPTNVPPPPQAFLEQPNGSTPITHKGCSRNYPRGGHIFSDPSTPRTCMESEPPDPQDTLL